MGWIRVVRVLIVSALLSGALTPGVGSQPLRLEVEEVLLAETSPGVDGNTLLVVSGFPNGRALFKTPTDLWTTDGSPQGTFPLPASIVFGLGNTGTDRLLFTGSEAGSFGATGIWSTDHTVDGTVELLANEDLSSDRLETQLLHSPSLGVSFFGRRAAGPSTSELWVTPGPSSPLALLLSPPNGFDRIRASDTFEIGRQSFLTTTSFSNTSPGTALVQTWRTDGTPAGTLDAAIEPPVSFPETIGSWTYYLSFDQGTQESNLWRTTGSPGPSQLVVEDVPGFLIRVGDDLISVKTSQFNAPTPFTTFRRLDLMAGSLVEIASLPTSQFSFRTLENWALWVSIEDFQPQSIGALRSSGFVELVSELERVEVPSIGTEGDRAHVNITTTSLGAEPWILDGTIAGTRSFDLCPGPCSSEVFPVLPENVRWEDGRSLYIGRLSSPLNATPAPSPATQFLLLDDLGNRPAEVASDFAENQGPRQPVALRGAENRLLYFRWDPASGFEPRAIPLPDTSCAPSPTTLCLGNNRFRVDVTWSDFQGGTGAGRSVPLTEDTGSFWFFDPDNLELIVKVIDGTAINGNHWVFYGALSDVAYELRVTDTETGRTATYSNPAGTFGSQGDVDALPGLGGKT
ncbi:MAG: hypothetical protein AAGK22_21685, partial [Acidobacteriota bacterium]